MLETHGTSALQTDASPEAQAQAITKTAEQEVQTLIPQGQVVTIANDEQYRLEGRKLVDIKNRIKDLENQRTAIVKPINDGVKRVNDLFKAGTERLKYLHDLIEKPMVAYQREQEAKRREAEAAARKEQERLQKEADEKAAAEKKRLQEIWDAQRKAEQEAAVAPNPVAAMLKAEEAARLNVQATEAKEAAEQAIRESVTVQAPVAYIPKASAAGTSVRHNWKFTITDASLIPRQYLIPDEKAIGEVARTLKDKAVIPGVEFKEDISIGGR